MAMCWLGKLNASLRKRNYIWMHISGKKVFVPIFDLFVAIRGSVFDYFKQYIRVLRFC